MKKNSILILGAGITGLAATWVLRQRGVDVRVLEAAPQPGGTLALAERSGFCFDAGIHVLHTQDREMLNFLELDLGLALSASRRRAFFIYKGQSLPYPFQVNTSCLPFGDRLRVFLESLRPRLKSPTDYDDFLRINFGPTLTHHFLAPYARKFWTVDPQELTLDWVGSRVPIPSLWHRLQGLFHPLEGNYGPNPYFYYPRQAGIGSLAKALVAPLQEHIICNTRVNTIFPAERRVVCDQGKEYQYDICISTIPLPTAVNLLQPSPTTLVERAAGLRYTTMLCLNIALRGNLPHDYHWVYFPSRDEPMARVHFPGNISAATVPPGYCSLQIEIPARGGMLHSDVSEVFVHQCLRRLESMSLVQGVKDNVVFVEQHQVDPAYVIHDHYRARHLPDILHYLRRSEIIPAGRFGLWGYHWMHDSISSGKAAAAEALTRIGL